MRISRTTLLPLAVLALLAVLPQAAEALDNGYVVSLCSRFLLYALAAVSLDLILGYGGMVSLGHAAYVGVGAYVVGILTTHAQDMAPLMTWPLEIAGSDSALITIPAAVILCRAWSPACWARSACAPRACTSS